MDVVTRSVVQAGLDATQYVQGAKQVEQANAGMVRSAEAVAIAGEKVEVTTTRGARSFEQLQQKLDGTYRAQQQYETSVDRLNRALDRGLVSQERYNQLLGLAQQRHASMSTATAQAGSAFGNLGQRIGQAGFQLQDFTVQVQAGTSWMTALSQQGSQFLGAFGTGGAIGGAILAMGLVAAQILGAKDAAEALNDAVERQKNLYEAANDAAERYRVGRQHEAEQIIQLTSYYRTLSTEMREAERLRLEAARGRLSQAQYDRALGATSRVNGLNAVNNPQDPTAIQPGMTLADSQMAIIGGPGQLSPGLQAATNLVSAFHERRQYTDQEIAALIVGLRQIETSGVAGAESVARLRSEIEAARPDLLRGSEELARNAAQLLALGGNAQGAAASIGGLGAALAAQLTPLRSLYTDLDKVNGQLAALRAGGLDGLEAADRSRTIMQRAGQDYDQEVASYVARGLSPADARARADETPLAERIQASADLVRRQQEFNAERERLEREKREREAAARRGATAGARVEARFGRLEDESEAQAEAAERVARAYMESDAAGRRAEATEQALAAVRRTGTQRTMEQDAAVRKIVEAHEREARAIADKQSVLNARRFEREQEILEAEIRLIGASAEARERELAAIRARQDIEGRNGDPNSEASRRLINSAQDLASARVEGDRLRASFEELQNIGTRAFDRIGEAITQAFADGSMKAIDFGNIAKAVMSEVAQDVIRLGLLNPVRNNLFGANLPTLGSVSQAAGMLFNGGGAGSASNGARASGGGLSGLFGGGGFSGIGGLATNPIWQPNIGFFSPAIDSAAFAPLGEGVYGPVASAGEGGMFGSLGGSSLAQYAAGIGGGYMIGSTLGSYLAGQSKARQQNAQIGAAAGAVIGSVIPGVGTIVGGLAGGAIGGAAGGLIGPGKGFSGGDVGVAVDANGYLTLGTSGGKRWNGTDARNQTSAGLNSINDLLRGVGVNLNGLQGAQLGYQGYGGSGNTFGPTEIWGAVRNNLTTSNSTLAAALGQGWMQSFEDLQTIAPFAAQNDNLTRALNSGGIRSRDDFNNAAQWITGTYEPLLQAASLTNKFTDAIAAQNKVYDDAIAKVRELGLAEGDLWEAREKSRLEAIDARNFAVGNATAALRVDELRATGRPGAANRAALVEFDIAGRQRTDQLSKFLEDNGFLEGSPFYDRTMGRLSTLLSTQRSTLQDTLREALAATTTTTADSGIATNSGTALLQNLLVGEAGGLSAQARFAGGVATLSNLRRSGNLDAYTSFASQFLGTARGYLGTSERFGDLTAQIKRDTVALGGDPTGLLRSIDVQTRTADGVEGLLRQLNVQTDEIKSLRRELAKLGSQMVTLQQRRAA